MIAAAPERSLPRATSFASGRLTRVSHVITGLGIGGAEIMLLKLLSAMDRAQFRSSVIALTDEGDVADRIRELGIPVAGLEMTRRTAIPATYRLSCELRGQRPDIVQTWMYHADLLGAVAALRLPRVPVVWNIRCGHLDGEIDQRETIW